MPRLMGYVLCRHGPKSIPDLRKHASSRQQMLNLIDFQNDRRVRLSSIIWDYARYHEGLAQLPELRIGLECAEDMDAILIMDDLGRLFRPLPLEDRGAFLDELMGAGGRLFGLRQGCILRDEPRQMKAWLRWAGEPGAYVYKRRFRRRRSEARRIAQTAKARKASARARREQALSHAREIARVRDELQEDGQKTTLAAIAEAANAKGMRTTRGNPWSSSSVSRALKRLQQEATDETEAA